ncbi:helix-turn-helix domain-containing protein [Lactobacillus sp. B3795]|uniref:helix-turn-helix domain-containing protein n=1 Tax=Lactobacillus sp. B3795 TaxID=2818036 RepID=UPI00265CEB42|nr:helix-turn-helix domain-containing protein [Lactobacillus sp. B3795]MCX8743731.1 helix-turn-helix domain-containing protein [Lactobacillus sp. B3795]
MQFGDRLKQQRKIKKLTQDDVAEKLNVSRQTISSWENEKSYPDIKSLISLSDMYDISLDTMLKEDSGMKEFIEKNDLSKKLLGLRCSIASFTMFALLLYFLNSVNAISSTYENATIFLMYLLFVLILLSFNKFIKSINLERSQISDTFRLNKYLKFILAALLIVTIELARYHIILPLIILIAALEIFIFIYYFRNK